MAVLIKAVSPHSPAQKAGVREGMRLCCINNNPICDGLDYEFYSSAAQLSLQLQVGDAMRTIAVQKKEYEPLGCEFDTYLIDAQHACKNRCIFCFVDQLPKGMRPSLYFKDDDERLGFLFGNYITLTNLSEREVERIIKMRFSPVNISVHTVNPALRTQMMHNKNAGKCLEIIPRLAKAGIEMNVQLVLCSGVNDGAELQKSLEWLAALHPVVRSVAAVPVGLTKHREGLHKLESYTEQSAKEQLDIMLGFGDSFAKRSAEGVRLVYPSDEWFLLSGRDVPPAEFYDGYPQLENGVGMWRLFCDEFEQELSEIQRPATPVCADVVCGSLAAPLMRRLASLLEQKNIGITLNVQEIRNDFFGHGVTVTGLLTGRDIIAQLKGRMKSGRLLLPKDVLRAEGDILLDDVSPEDIAAALGVEVKVLDEGAQALLCALEGQK